jgi:hypothetical protein
MNQSAPSTLPNDALPNDSLKEAGEYKPLNAEAETNLIELIRFATREIESEIKQGHVMQNEIDQHRVQINEAIARLIAA